MPRCVQITNGPPAAQARLTLEFESQALAARFRERFHGSAIIAVSDRHTADGPQAAALQRPLVDVDLGLNFDWPGPGERSYVDGKRPTDGVYAKFVGGCLHAVCLREDAKSHRARAELFQLAHGFGWHVAPGAESPRGWACFVGPDAGATASADHLSRCTMTLAYMKRVHGQVSDWDDPGIQHIEATCIRAFGEDYLHHAWTADAHDVVCVQMARLACESPSSAKVTALVDESLDHIKFGIRNADVETKLAARAPARVIAPPALASARGWRPPGVRVRFAADVLHAPPAAAARAPAAAAAAAVPARVAAPTPSIR